MFLTVHAAGGIAVSKLIPNPILAFIVSFILHYVFDIIPHGDNKVPTSYKNPIYIVTAGIIDLVVLYFYLIYLMFNGLKLLNLNVLFALIASLLPDILQGLYFIYKKRWLKKLKDLHDKNHNYLPAKYELEFWPGICLQIIIFLVLTLVII